MPASEYASREAKVQFADALTAGKTEKIVGQDFLLIGLQMICGHDGARGKSGRIGEMTVHPVAAAAPRKTIERGPYGFSHAIDGVAGRALAALVYLQAGRTRRRRN